MLSIEVVAEKGGVGKSTIVDEIAYELDRRHASYAVVDLDGQGGLAHEGVGDGIDEPDYAVVDTPGRLDETSLSLLGDADVIIVPTRPSKMDTVPLLRTLELIKARRRPDARLAVVVNGITPYTAGREWMEGFVQIMADYMPLHLFILPQSESVARGQMEGTSARRHGSEWFRENLDHLLAYVLDGTIPPWDEAPVRG